MSNSMSFRSSRSWLCLAGIILLQSLSGTSSLFSAYSSLLKQRFSISNMQVINLVVALDTGKLLEWFPSAAADHLPLWMVLLIGLIFGSVGYGVQYLYLENKIHSLSYWQVFLLCLLAGNSICWIQTYCYFAAVTNFNNHKTLAALTSCYSTLSGKVYTSLVEGIQGRNHSPNPSTYLLLNCIVPALVGTIVALIIGCPKLTEYRGTNIFTITFVITIATGVYAMLGNLVQPVKNLSPQLQAVILVSVIMLPTAVPLVRAAHGLAVGKWQSKVMPELSDVVTKSNCNSVIEGFSIDINEDARGEKRDMEVKVDEGIGKVGKIKLGDEHGLKNLVMSLDFWLFFWVNACGPMLGTVYVNNLGRISESYGNHEVSSLLAVFSATGFFGKISQVIFEWCTRGRSILSKPASMVLVMIPMPASFFLLICGSTTCLYISTGILGTCSGAIRAITASTIPELFGHQNSVVNHNIVLTNIPIGTLLFGYLDAINYENGSGNYGLCEGFECHYKTFIIWGSICSVGTILSFVLHLRTREFYS